MSKATLVVDPPASDKPLSSIISAEAKIAMPEVISIFISDYETKLYDRKTELQQKIHDLKKDLEIHVNTVAKSGSFKKYIGVKVPKLGLISRSGGEANVSWENGTISMKICFDDVDETGKMDAKRNSGNNFSKSFTVDITDFAMRTFKNLKKKIDEESANLSRTVGLIGDMSRKERQVKARISELRLKEQGLEGFLADKEMQKLISI
jgi:hypothetical protein